MTVKNVAPSITGPIDSLQVDEGQAFVLSDLVGNTTINLGLGLTDPGFDNPLNPNPASPGIADPTHETFSGMTINWGDGTTTDTLTIVDRASDLVDGPTTAKFQVAPHTYADDGDYTVTITAFDDNGGQLTPQTFTIHVNNVVPTLAMPVPSAISIDEAQSVNFTVGFSDPGFDNPANPNPAAPPTIIDPKSESFHYFIDWGDGRDQVGAVSAAAVADMNGGVGIPSTGSFGGTHNYADDGVYTVTVRIADDNMTAFNTPTAFASGTAGVDFVERTFTVTVHNVTPSIVLPLEGDQVNTGGFTKIRLSFSDPGYDNPLNPTPPPNGSQTQESFTYLVNWGDGTTDTITVVNVSGTPQVINSQTSVLSSNRTSGSEGVLTTAGMEVQHKYSGPPDPLNPIGRHSHHGHVHGRQWRHGRSIDRGQQSRHSNDQCRDRHDSAGAAVGVHAASIGPGDR